MKIKAEIENIVHPFVDKSHPFTRRELVNRLTVLFEKHLSKESPTPTLTNNNGEE